MRYSWLHKTFSNESTNVLHIIIITPHR